MFFVGQKVARTPNTYNVGAHPQPEIGEVVTVSKILFCPCGKLLQFIEYEWPGNEDIFPGYNAEAFRPIVEKKTDISIFTKMLNPDKRRINA